MKTRVEDLITGVKEGDRAVIGQAITLVESSLDQDKQSAHMLLEELLPHTGNAHRVGITGAPGVGKSTLIESLGTKLTDAGHRVAVLAVDPTSSITKGSILGDKTRMAQLANDPAAFIRPSPSSGTLGGVARTTRETMLVLEAAGYDVVIVETVGVGQSETEMASMVDTFLALLLPGAGDELQGIKKGVLEVADLIAVNKADGDNLTQARNSVNDYTMALRLTRPTNQNWNPKVMMVSGLTGDGLDDLWSLITHHRQVLTQSGDWDQRRREQSLSWMWSTIESHVISGIHSHPKVVEILERIEEEVSAGVMNPRRGAEEILKALEKD
ncbi:MAG: putative GTPase [Acidimicrobiales bacterium AG-410-I20]|nr:MAG: putative GTPase [Acidimicrobiales bacterium AG-410-I20]